MAELAGCGEGHIQVGWVPCLWRVYTYSSVGRMWREAHSGRLGSLFMEGTHVRLSGQDVERGTFR